MQGSFMTRSDAWLPKTTAKAKCYLTVKNTSISEYLQKRLASVDVQGATVQLYTKGGTILGCRVPRKAVKNRRRHWAS